MDLDSYAAYLCFLRKTVSFISILRQADADRDEGSVLVNEDEEYLKTVTQVHSI